MYQLDRARKGKIAFGVLALVFVVLFIFGYGTGGYEVMTYGYMNEPIATIIMVVSLFSAVICLVAFLTMTALEKDIAEWLKILEKRINNGHQQ